jgi:hypothetical protein
MTTHEGRDHRAWMGGRSEVRSGIWWRYHGMILAEARFLNLFLK